MTILIIILAIIIFTELFIIYWQKKTYEDIHDIDYERIKNLDNKLALGYKKHYYLRKIIKNYEIITQSSDLQAKARLLEMIEKYESELEITHDIYRDGNLYCVLLGYDLQEGIAGFGSSPDAAISDFSKNYQKFIEDNHEQN